MNEVKFTKGPWLAETDQDGSFCITGKGGHRKHDYYVICSREKHSLTEETHANASLISLAPELYEALESTLLQCLAWQGEPHEHSCSVHKAVVDRARAALSKARGEQK